MIDRLLFTAMTGAKHSMGQLANTTHNLANAQTPGFREVLSSFRAVPVDGVHADSRTFVVDSTPGANWTPGSLNITDQPLDVAIEQSGLFTLRNANGDWVHSRSGKFHLDPEGVLRNVQGYAVIDDQGKDIRIEPGSSDIQISEKGLIRAKRPNEMHHTDVARLMLVDPEKSDLTREADGTFMSAFDPMDVISDRVRVQQGALENSNVNVAEAMVQMIQQNRLFDLNIQMVKVAEQNAKSASSLMSLSRV